MAYNDYGRSNMSDQQPTYFYTVQNPAYPPIVPDNEKDCYNYMPPPPPYNQKLNPEPSAYPYAQQPRQTFFEAYNSPTPHVEVVPPEYNSDPVEISVFTEKTIRRAFIRKVYITLSIQLAITVGLICTFIFCKPLKYWVRKTTYFTFALCGCGILLVLVLVFCDKIRRKVPLNFIMLGVFTVIEGCMLGSFSALYEADAVMWAVGATIFVTLGLTLFALQTKWDFTMLSGGLCMSLLVLISFGILCAIIRSQWLSIVYASIGTLIFGMYLVFDTQLILGGKHRYSINPEEYIFAALNIYLDIVNLFILLLQLIGMCR